MRKETCSSWARAPRKASTPTSSTASSARCSSKRTACSTRRSRWASSRISKPTWRGARATQGRDRAQRHVRHACKGLREDFFHALLLVFSITCGFAKRPGLFPFLKRENRVVSFACPERPERPNQGTEWERCGRAGRKEPNRVGVHCQAGRDS